MSVVDKKRDLLRLLRGHNDRYLKLQLIDGWRSWLPELSQVELLIGQLTQTQQSSIAIADSLVSSTEQLQLKSLPPSHVCNLMPGMQVTPSIFEKSLQVNNLLSMLMNGLETL